VSTESWVFTSDLERSFNIGSADVAYDPDGNAIYPSAITSLLSNIEVTVSSYDIDATTRGVDIRWRATDPRGFFIDDSFVFNFNGQPATSISFSFGMDTFGVFPGAPLNQFDDPDFQHVLSSRGTLYFSNGTVAGLGGLFTEDYTGGFGGRVLFVEIDRNGHPTGGEIADNEWEMYESTVIYQIPAPASTGVFSVAVLIAVRRRRTGAPAPPPTPDRQPLA